MIKTSPEPHQIEGAKFMVKKKAAILGFKPGKGKTLTSMACIHQHVYGKDDYVIVAAPVKAYDKVWPQQITEHTDMKWIRLPDVHKKYKQTGDLAFLTDYDIVLLKYPDVQKYTTLDTSFMRYLFNNRIFVCDEAHKLKNPNAKLVRVLSYLTGPCKAKWGLTATAIGNSLMDFWGLMHFFNPRVFGTQDDFKREYCVMEDKVIGKHTSGPLKGRLRTVKEVVDFKNLDKLNEIKDQFVMVVDSDVTVQYHEIIYSITEEEEKLYLVAAKGVLDKELEPGEKKMFAQRIPDIQRAVDGSKDIDGNVRYDYRSSKYMRFRKVIGDILKKGESVLVFAEFLDTHAMLANLIRQDFKQVPIYEISGAKVEDPKKHPCIVLATAGGSESLNLKFANHVLFFSVPFSVKAFIQMVGRITRMDSEFLEDLNVYIPYCDITIDYYKYKYLKVNSELISKVLGKEANLPEKAQDDERRDMMGQLRKNLLYRTKRLVKKS